jgi:hypothetical protein
LRRICKIISLFLISFGLFFSIVFVSGYSNFHDNVRAIESNTSFEHKEPTQLRPLTLDQVKNFVKAKGISPLATKNINNYTVILHETNGAIGYYGLTSKQNGKLYSESSGSGRNSANITPVSIGLGGGSDNIDGTLSFYSFAWVVINDYAILDKASLATLILDDNTVISEPVNRNKAIIIPNAAGNSRLTNLIIYDKNSEVLYKQKL